AAAEAASSRSAGATWAAAATWAAEAAATSTWSSAAGADASVDAAPPPPRLLDLRRARRQRRRPRRAGARGRTQGGRPGATLSSGESWNLLGVPSPPHVSRHVTAAAEAPFLPWNRAPALRI